MHFSSDNAAGVAPEVMEALIAANQGSAMAYGGDPLTARATEAIAALFETECAVFPVATGTAANALALSALTPPWGMVYCHREAHIEVDEAAAPEFYSGGGKLHLLDGPHGKLQADVLAAALAGAGFGVQHHPQPAALSLTQASEAGTCYAVDEVAALAGVAHLHGLAVHMDGARFANAVAHLGCTPAEVTWKAGVDVLSFGATKNGAMAAEAVVFFRPGLADDFLFRRKRGGHLFSKMRFLSAQLLAYVEDGRWLRWAGHANAMARRLADGLAALPGAELVHRVEANEVFIALPAAMLDAMAAEGVVFHRWGAGGRPVARLVAAFSTTEQEVDGAVAAARRHATG